MWTVTAAEAKPDDDVTRTEANLAELGMLHFEIIPAE